MSTPTTPAQPTPPGDDHATSRADIELPACFYLGREYDLANQKPLDKPVMYDARDLTTHGVVVGMTGSGKTGLCLSLLEEAAIDGIPCILIDPKGDLTNLLLQFPDLTPHAFGEWLNPEDSRRKGLTLDEHAAQLSEGWRQGLADTYQKPARINLLKDSAEWRIYTPGSEAGLPLSILKTFAAPQGKVPREALNQKIDATTTALLGLTGISADPVQSREHILIAQLLLHAWSRGRDLDLHGLIEQIQMPPMTKIGAFDVDTFYPEKERLKLAVALNNILAAPSFSTWVQGEPLDLGLLLQGGNKQRHLIFYIAHLEDAQRMFFLTLLLEEVLSWTRKQAGTTSLRAILYFDEVFGYLPPYPANPPTKLPLMTLLKQARAFGVGVLLATQNPVDLDYKALSNAGTWFVGKLQTERDKARLVEGLEGVAAAQGTLTNKAYLENVISALGNRVFLLHNVHRGKPVLFQTRQTLSFLGGPLTRDHVAKLMGPLKATLPESRAAAEEAVQAIPLCNHCRTELPLGVAACPSCGTPLATPRREDQVFKQALQQAMAPVPTSSAVAQPPELPPDVPQFYLPLPAGLAGRPVVYQPRLLAMADVSFMDKKRNLLLSQGYGLLAVVPAAGEVVDWNGAERLNGPLAVGREMQARWLPVPELLTNPRKLKALEKAFADYLYNLARLTLLENRKLNIVGEVGEDVLTFQERCRALAQEEAQKAIAAEKLKYQPRFAALGVNVPDEPAMEEAGTSLLALFLPWRWFGLGGKEKRPPGQGNDKVARLEREWLEKRGAILARWQPIGAAYSALTLAPRRQDIQVIRFGIGWLPVVNP